MQSGAGLLASALFQEGRWISPFGKRNSHDFLKAAYDDNRFSYGGSIPWHTNSPGFTSNYFFPLGVMLKTLYPAGHVIHCLNVANLLRFHLRQSASTTCLETQAAACSQL